MSSFFASRAPSALAQLLYQAFKLADGVQNAAPDRCERERDLIYTSNDTKCCTLLVGLLSRGPLVYSPSCGGFCILTCPVGGGDQQGLPHIPLKELALSLSVWVVGAQEEFNTGQFLKPEGPLSSGLGTHQ